MSRRDKGESGTVGGPQLRCRIYATRRRAREKGGFEKLGPPRDAQNGWPPTQQSKKAAGVERCPLRMLSGDAIDRRRGWDGFLQRIERRLAAVRALLRLARYRLQTHGSQSRSSRLPIVGDRYRFSDRAAWPQQGLRSG
jgi:hypothetical protein